MTRTKKEVTTVIAKTINSIRSHAIITSAIIKKECAKNKISEKAIRVIAQGSGTKIVSLNKSNYDE